MKLTFIVLSLLFCSLAYSEDFNNGCGSGWNEPVVPDRIPLTCIDFKSACAAHDNCYSKCLPGGENFGKPICEQKLTEQTEGRRLICDNVFLADMRKTCESCSAVSKPVCKGISAIYSIVVKKAGKGSFNGREVPDEYYDFIASERAKNFDFDSFVEEVNLIQEIDSIGKHNTLKIEIENGFPVAEFRSINQEVTPQLTPSGRAYKIEKIQYGNVDLSNASNGERLLSVDDLNLENLKLEKLESRLKFAPAER